ncbi:MAG: hypothetical protein CL607_27170 [Anaerolineaceae bacterium]|nr:hypothetical protein [Anaerolineaceae bacterium]
MTKPKRISKVFPRGLKRIDILVIAIVILGIARLVWTLMMNDIRPPWVAVQMCFPILFIVPIVFLSLGGMASVALIDGREIFEVLGLLMVAFFVVAALPMPERELLPETLHFQEHRSEYEAVVQLARNGSLESGQPDCPAGYLPPEEYAHVSEAACMGVSQSDTEGLKVQFSPLDHTHYHVVVYSEPDKRIRECPGNYYIEEVIDDNWTVCFQDW